MAGEDLIDKAMGELVNALTRVTFDFPTSAEFANAIKNISDMINKEADRREANLELELITIDVADLGDPPPREHRGIEQIMLADNEVKIRGDTLGDIWWRGRQWAVTNHGLECLDGTYFIEKGRLLEKDEYSWPEHMSGKVWVDVEEFTTAWVIGLVLYGHKPSASKVRKIFAKLPPRREPMRRFGSVH